MVDIIDHGGIGRRRRGGLARRADRQDPRLPGGEDRRAFLDILGAVVGDFNWVCHAWCLMTNRYHLVVETPDGNLAKGMRGSRSAQFRLKQSMG